MSIRGTTPMAKEAFERSLPVRLMTAEYSRNWFLVIVFCHQRALSSGRVLMVILSPLFCDFICDTNCSLVFYFHLRILHCTDEKNGHCCMAPKREKEQNIARIPGRPGPEWIYSAFQYLKTEKTHKYRTHPDHEYNAPYETDRIFWYLEPVFIPAGDNNFRVPCVHRGSGGSQEKRYQPRAGRAVM